jgi:hypothetical protein
VVREKKEKPRVGEKKAREVKPFNDRLLTEKRAEPKGKVFFIKPTMDTLWIIFVGIFIFGSCSSKCLAAVKCFLVSGSFLCVLFSALNCFS